MTDTHADLVAGLSKLSPNLFGFGAPYLSQEMLRSPPLAPSRYTFLLQAIVRAGHATQGAGWQDWETATRYCPGMTKPTLTVEGQLSQHRRPVKPPPATLTGGGAGSFGGSGNQYAVALAQWEADAPKRQEAAESAVRAVNEAWEKAEAERAAHAPGVEALHAAFRSLSVAIVERQVDPYARLRSGGPVFDIKPDLFASEGLVGRVIREGVLTEGGAQVFLFVDKAQLEQTFPVAPPQVEPSDFEGLHLSQSLKLALLTARDWGITPDNQPKVEALAEHIKSLAKVQGETLSHSRALAIARVLRDGFGG